MGNCSANIKEIRFVFEPELTQAYFYVEASGDCPLGVQGVHHKTFPASKSAKEILEDVGVHEDYLLWPLNAPPEA